mgnify:FL=1
MKTKFLALAISLGFLFTSCSDDDNPTPTVGPATGEITGTYTADQTFVYGNYTLNGVVKVNSGVTLTFEAGSTITCNKSNGDNALVVLKGGKLIVNGTADAPVIFTEASGIPGSWGGITLYGDAPINAAKASSTSTSEDGNFIVYGGSNKTDSSGSLKYVQDRYAGAKLADGNSELNGFSFYAVGSGTVLDHLVSYKGNDDGFEFYGGTASMTNAISYGNTDDSFDWQDGWQGAANTNWYAKQMVKGNYGMEIESSNNNNAYFPIVSNITLIRDAGTEPETSSSVEIDAIQFKKQGNGQFNNIVINGFGNYATGGVTYTGTAVKIQDQATNTDQVNTGKIKVTNVKMTNTTVDVLGATVSGSPLTISFPAGNFTTSTTATGAVMNSGTWSTVDGVDLLK